MKDIILYKWILGILFPESIFTFLFFHFIICFNLEVTPTSTIFLSSGKSSDTLCHTILKGEKELNELAAEQQIAPNQLRKWKSEFLQNAANVFSDKRADTLQEKLKEERRENEQYAKKVGQLTMQVDWLKKNMRKYLDRDTRISILQNLSKTKEVPVSMGAKLLDVNRTTVYYTPVSISNEELECKAIIDCLHLENPS